MKTKLEFKKQDGTQIFFNEIGDKSGNLYAWKADFRQGITFWNFILIGWNKDIDFDHSNFQFPELPDSYLKTSLLKFLNRS